MPPKLSDVKLLLDAEVLKRNSQTELCQERLDPIMVAHRYHDERISLICALFAYGNVKQIVKFLDSLDFSLLDADEEEIKSRLSTHYYRFQNSADVTALFIALKRLHANNESLEELFYKAYYQNKNLFEGLHAMIERLYALFPHNSQGYNFLLSKVQTNPKGAGALKRWMMYLRWMIRHDNIDMGLWSAVACSDLVMPLDTHTFKVSQKLGLLKRKSYDLAAAIELTQKLKKFDKNDPLKYDFALYRIGQEKLF
jgi:uncharacterized protein (TIGR02757 family)